MEGLFADNSFLSRSVDHSDFVNGKTVHVPNAGAAPNVEKDRQEYPAKVETRTDIDLTYQIHEYTVDPIRIPHADKVELSYNKRESVLRQSRSVLHDRVAKDILSAWTPTESEAQQKLLKGEGLTRNDVRALQKAFNDQEIPQVGRVLLLSSDAHDSLLADLTDSQSNAFLAAADATKGIVGRLFSFDVMLRSTVGDLAGLAWHPDFLSRSVGDIDFYDEEKSVVYYADVIGFLVRAGGSILRKDGKGVRSVLKEAI